MSACGRHEDDDGLESSQVEAELQLLAKPKPGSCCSRKQAQGVETATAASSTATCCSSATSTATATAANSCGGGCACRSDHAATAATSSSSSAAPSSSSTTPYPLSGGVPPARLKESRPAVSGHLPCHRCKDRRAQVTLKDNISCSTCFTSLVASRLKGALRTKCMFTKGAKLLLAVSGGASSTCMCHVLSVASDPSSQRRMFFGFDLLYIDESAILVGSEEEHAEFTRQVEELYAPYRERSKWMRVPLEDVMAIGTDREGEMVTAAMAKVSLEEKEAPAATSASPASASSNANRTALQALFAGLKDPSDKQDLRDLLRLRLLAHVARTHGYAQLVLGDNATRTAVDSFADTAKGRGATVPLSVLYRETRFQVECFYPLRDQNSKHVALYNHHKRLKPLYRAGFLTTRRAGIPGIGGLNQLTHEFICMLDAKFNSSVANIVGTVSKLKLPEEFGKEVEEKSHCSLCGRARVAAETAASTLAGNVEHVSAPRPAQAANLALLSTIPSCYGCGCLMRELSDASLLPPFVQAGQHRDHRAADDPRSSLYPLPFNHLLRVQGSAALSHEERARINREKKMREQNQQGEEEEGSNGTTDAHAASRPQHPGLQKQSREEMRASISEFLLGDD